MDRTNLIRRLRRRATAVPAALGIALLTAGAAGAQDTAAAPAESTESANIVSYPASFYAESRPSTALDMVKRTPGFTYSAGNQDVRGLTGAIGNVLVDGQLQTSKTVTLDDTLQRLPADQVVRIDIVRAGAGGIDMAGFPVVANVIRRSGAQSQTTIQIEPRIWMDVGAFDGGARLDWSRSAGDLKLSGALAVNSERYDEGGEGRLVRLRPDGTVLDAGDFVGDHDDKSVALNGGVEYRAGSTLYRTNFGYTHQRSDRNELGYLSAFEWFRLEEDADKGEAGLNVEHKFTPALTGKLDALQTYQEKADLAGRIGRLTQTEARAGESNLRGALAYRPSATLGIEAGAEGAFNFLDQTSTLTAANANVRVEERRTQPFVTMNWQIAAPVGLELGARYETSTISQTGDTNSERTFQYFKPRAIAAIDIFDTTQVRLRYERVVKQLDFNDFTASTGQQEGASVAGNARLQPERAWVSEIAVEQRLWPRSTVVLTYTHEAVKETWDYVRITPTTDGKGNVGAGTRDNITADIKIALDPLGIPGGRFEANPQYYMSETVDPFTGKARPISGSKGIRGRASFYLDRPSMDSTFALEYGYGMRSWSYRIDQVSVTAQQRFINVWWEWTPQPGLAIRTTVNAISGRQRDRNRDVYTGPRNVSVVSYREERYLERHPWFVLRVRKTL
jgi:hypothetical protein